MKADISVIIPCYNAEKYIAETLDSIINQTLPCREIIVVNDGSTDSSLNILTSYKDKIKIENISNSGPAVARNVGIKIATSKYIAFCDADDLWHPNKIECQFSYLLDRRAKFVCTDSFLIGNNIDKFEPLKPNSNILDFETLFLCNYIYTSSVLVDRDLLNEVGCFSPRFKNMQDWHLWLKISLKEDIHYLFKKLIYYRLHPSGISKNFLVALDYGYKLINDILSIAPEYNYLKNKAIYSLTFGTGTIAYYSGNYSAAKKIFWKAFCYNPRSFLALKYLIYSYIFSFFSILKK